MLGGGGVSCSRKSSDIGGLLILLVYTGVTSAFAWQWNFAFQCIDALPSDKTTGKLREVVLGYRRISCCFTSIRSVQVLRSGIEFGFFKCDILKWYVFTRIV